MRNSDGFYLNGNNSTVQVTLAHDTSEINKILISDSRQIKKNYSKVFVHYKSMFTFVVRHFYINIWFVDFLCPQISYCLRYKQRFLRAYSPTSQYESVATWRNSLLSLFINI
jgi:hypothetical protein